MKTTGIILAVVSVLAALANVAIGEHAIAVCCLSPASLVITTLFADSIADEANADDE